MKIEVYDEKGVQQTGGGTAGGGAAGNVTMQVVTVPSGGANTIDIELTDTFPLIKISGAVTGGAIRSLALLFNDDDDANNYFCYGRNMQADAGDGDNSNPIGSDTGIVIESGSNADSLALAPATSEIIIVNAGGNFAGVHYTAICPVNGDGVEIPSTSMGGGVWMNTDAITKITIGCEGFGTDLTEGSQFLVLCYQP